jgi:hypothetical protein
MGKAAKGRAKRFSPRKRNSTYGVAFTGTARAFGSAPVAQLPLAGLSAAQR